LQELTLFQYIQVAGGNKYREGYRYKITNLNENNTLKNSIETALQKTLETIKAEHSKTVGQSTQTDPQPTEKQAKKSRTTNKKKIANE